MGYFKLQHRKRKMLQTYQALLARGRKVYLLSSAYEVNNEQPDLENEDEYVEEKRS